ncbi:MAG TPA: hypothetical protein VK864_13595, partial [Longimicrobiales bacterium]|nr:hypothetical protein [Longimicrobiales bacterium]
MKSPVPILAVVVLTSAGQAAAQQSGQPAGDAPRIFLDCSYFCDENFIRTEMNWLNWVRDRADAQVHVLVTRQTTGGGGAEWTMNFIGLKQFEGRSDTLKYVSSTDDSEDLIRQGMVRVLKAGVIPFVMNTSLARRLQIALDTVNAATPSSAPAQGQSDPWNYWVFSLG